MSGFKNLRFLPTNSGKITDKNSVLQALRRQLPGCGLTVNPSLSHLAILPEKVTILRGVISKVASLSLTAIWPTSCRFSEAEVR